jgi:lipoprotein
MNFEMIKKFFVFCGVILSCGCGNKSNRELQHIELGEFQNQIKNDSVAYRIVCIIDGGCSLCIGDFVELNMNFLKGKNEYKCPLYYFVMTGDPVIFKGNLMKFNQVVSGELFVDTTYSLMRTNQLFKESRIEVFLINKDNQIVVSGNPFIDKKVRCQYDNLLK